MQYPCLHKQWGKQILYSRKTNLYLCYLPTATCMQCHNSYERVSHSVLSDSLWPHGLYSPGLNPGLLHCSWVLYQLNHKGNPRIRKWLACPFSSGSSWPRNQTGVSCIAGRFFTNWTIRKAYIYIQFFFLSGFLLIKGRLRRKKWLKQ